MIEKRTLNLVQLLRGIASILVLLMHITNTLKLKFNINFLGGVFMFGGAGVDIFFVLSGFIIAYNNKNIRKKASYFKVFLQKRIIRIYPIYWIVISIFLILQVLLPSYYNSLYPLTVVNLMCTYLLFPGHYMIDPVSWTLTYEIFFYLIFSLLFLINSRTTLLILSSCYIIVLILSSIFFYLEIYDNLLLKLILYPGNIEFFLGILCSMLVSQIKIGIGKFSVIAGSVLFIIAGLFSNGNYYLFNNGLNKIIIYGIPSFLIVLGIVRIEFQKSYKINNILIYLGEASYSLYLIHLPITVAYFAIIAILKINSSISLHVLAFILIVFLCTVCIVFYRFIEKPLIKTLNKI